MRFMRFDLQKSPLRKGDVTAQNVSLSVANKRMLPRIVGCKRKRNETMGERIRINKAKTRSCYRWGKEAEHLTPILRLHTMPKLSGKFVDQSDKISKKKLMKILQLLENTKKKLGHLEQNCKCLVKYFFKSANCFLVFVAHCVVSLNC